VQNYTNLLSTRTRAYQEHGERLTGVDISREITSLKRRECPWLGEANSTVLTQVLRDQDHAFQNFFEGRAKYPMFSSSKFTPLANAIGPVMVKALVPRRHCRQYQR
jgi:transposase